MDIANWRTDVLKSNHTRTWLQGSELVKSSIRMSLIPLIQASISIIQYKRTQHTHTIEAHYNALDIEPGQTTCAIKTFLALNKEKWQNGSKPTEPQKQHTGNYWKWRKSQGTNTEKEKKLRSSPKKKIKENRGPTRRRSNAPISEPGIQKNEHF